MIEEDVIKTTRELIQIPSITPLGEDKQIRLKYFEACDEAIEYLKTELYKIPGIKIIQKLNFEGGHEKWGYPVPNLYVQIDVGNPSATDHKFTCYMGHIDVVPPGDVTLWTEDPFSGTLRDGFIYGRGATDMKGSVAAWITAIKSLLKNLPSGINASIGTLITADEEWAAINGSDRVLAWMKENGIAPDSFIVGEPSSPDYLGSHIKIGRRGSLVGYLEATGVQGHRAYDALFINPNRALSSAVTLLHTLHWNDGTTYFPDTTFEVVSMHSGDFNASAIVPETAKALWNIRFTNRQSKKMLFERLQGTLQSPPEFFRDMPEYEEIKKIVVTANMATASEPYYSEPSTLANSTRRAIRTTIGIEAAYDGFGGTTDGRFVHKYFPDAQIIEFGLPEKGGITSSEQPSDYSKRGGMHQIDERVSQEDLRKLSEIYRRTIINYNQRSI